MSDGSTRFPKLLRIGKSISAFVEILTVFYKGIAAAGVTGLLIVYFGNYEALVSSSPPLIRYTWLPLVLLVVFFLFASVLGIFLCSKYRIRLERHRAIANICSSIGADIARSNTQLFHHYSSTPSPRSLEMLKHSRELLNNYLDQALDKITALFTAYTGDQCAVCVKCILISGDNPETWQVETLLRDTTSKGRRNITQKVSDNDAYMAVVKDGDPCFKCNNLRDRKRYVNNRPNWQKNLNATFVYPLPPLETQDRSQAEVFPLALLCVDNHKGGFDNTFCVLYIAALSWYVVTLLSLLDSVQSELDTLAVPRAVNE